MKIILSPAKKMRENVICMTCGEKAFSVKICQTGQVFSLKKNKNSGKRNEG
jgi:alpha-tubulin suppressor-like RCC1 family protein